MKWYNARKGFGFVLGPDGQDVFFHASALTEAGIEPPETGDTLVCEIGSDRQGRRLVTKIIERRLGEGAGAAGAGPRPFREGSFQDRPPHRDFAGGGGYQDRPPRPTLAAVAVLAVAAIRTGHPGVTSALPPAGSARLAATRTARHRAVISAPLPAASAHPGHSAISGRRVAATRVARPRVAATRTARRVATRPTATPAARPTT